MTFHDWINNVRWKYFTNNKSGLIFKELMKEFRMVEQMTENKRFTVDYDITVGNYCLHDEYEAKGVDGYIAYLSDEERANNLCDLLNEQEDKLKRIEKEVNNCNIYRDDLKDIILKIRCILNGDME